MRSPPGVRWYQRWLGLKAHVNASVRCAGVAVGVALGRVGGGGGGDRRRGAPAQAKRRPHRGDRRAPARARIERLFAHVINRFLARLRDSSRVKSGI